MAPRNVVIDPSLAALEKLLTSFKIFFFATPWTSQKPSPYFSVWQASLPKDIKSLLLY